MSERLEGFAGLLQELTPPMVIAVEGPPGSGKTSYLQMLLATLDNAPDLAATWANALNYNPQRHILPAIMTQLAREVGAPGLFDIAVEFCTGYIAVRDTAERIAHRTQSPEGVAPFKQLVEANLAEPPRGQDSYLAIEALQELYVRFLETILATIGQSTVALFVDDLDACDPVVVDQFLLDLFTYCAVPGSRILWILGIDLAKLQKQAARGARRALPIDKLINLRVQVPAAHSVKDLVVSQFDQIGLGGKPSKNAQTILLRLLDECAITNPRLVKRVTSRIGYALAFGSYPKKNTDQAELFVAMALLYEGWPEIHRALLHDISLALHLFGNFANTAKTGKASAQTLQQALKGQHAPAIEAVIEDHSMHLCVGKVSALITGQYNLRGSAMDEVIAGVKNALRAVAEIF